MKNLVGFVSNALIPVYAGHVLGVRAVGLIGWSRTIAYTPLKLTEIIGRVGFPLYSRLQGDSRALGNALGKSIHVCAAGAYVFIGIVLGLGPEIVHVAYPKWVDALPLLYAFAGTLTLGILSPVIAPAFDAIGRPGVFLRLGVVWTAIGWVIVPITTARWGVLGFVGGYLTQVVAGNAMAIGLVRSTFPSTRVWTRVRGTGIAMLAEIAGARLGLARLVTGPISLLLAVAGCVVVFGAVVLLVDRRPMLDAFAMVQRSRRPAAPDGAT
jgi:O-antigen/teichoic acid export membrane protein